MRKWLNKNIIALSFVSLFDDFAYELTIAILPAFLISINSSAATFGLIVGIANLFSFLKILSGRISDKLNTKKPIAVIGYTLNSISLIVLTLSSNWVTVFISWVFTGLAKSIREPARNALLIESTTYKYYGRVFGFHRTIDSVGAIFGPMCALFLIKFLSFKYIFLISFFISIIALLILILFVKQATHDLKTTQPLITYFKFKELPKQFRLFLLSIGIFSLGNFANSLLIFRTIELLTPLPGYTQFTAQTTAIFLYTTYNIFCTIFSYPTGYLADKFGTKNILVIGQILTTLVSIGFMFNINLVIISLLFIITGIAAAITNSMPKSLTASLIDGKIHGTGLGLYSTITGFAFMFANFSVGFLWSRFSPFYGFGYSAIFCLLGTILLFKLVNDN